MFHPITLFGAAKAKWPANYPPTHRVSRGWSCPFVLLTGLVPGQSDSPCLITTPWRTIPRVRALNLCAYVANWTTTCIYMIIQNVHYTLNKNSRYFFQLLPSCWTGVLTVRLVKLSLLNLTAKNFCKTFFELKM